MAYDTYAEKFAAYLDALERPFKKVTKLEFLQPDGSVAFALGGAGQRIPVAGRDTRAFLQSGSLSVSLGNGARRKASVVLANADGAFDYAVNKLWFGRRLRLLMGLLLPDGEEFYFPQGVFEIVNPSALFTPSERTITLSLSDKWSVFDGTLGGNLDATYEIGRGVNIFTAIRSLLRLSRYTLETTSDPSAMFDPTEPVFTTYFNGKTYSAAASDGSITTDIPMTDTPYEVREERGSTMAELILSLNSMLAGWVGYDATGALRLEPSQDDIDDADKAVLYAFTPENSVLLSLSETVQNTEVYNDITIAGTGLSDEYVWARAVNVDPSSDTNIYRIGRRILYDEAADYWNADQCASLARWRLKRKTILHKSVTVTCGQVFHLQENRLISVRRTDKPGQPVEKHLIEGYSIPIAETGSMTVNCTSVTDIPNFEITTSYSPPVE